MRQTIAMLLSSLCLLCAAPAFAAYRCGGAGAVTYSDLPCPNGPAVLVDTAASARNPEREEQAARQSEQEKRQFKQLENERRKRDAQAEKERQRDAHVQAARRKRCSLLAHRRTWAEEDVASATGKAADRAKLKARRVAEQFDEQCREQRGLLGG